MYVVTGYNVAEKKLRTHMFTNFQQVVDLLTSFPATNEMLTAKYKNMNDFDFDIQSRRSHFGAVILEGQDICWSISRV